MGRMAGAVMGLAALAGAVGLVWRSRVAAAHAERAAMLTARERARAATREREAVHAQAETAVRVAFEARARAADEAHRREAEAIQRRFEAEQAALAADIERAEARAAETLRRVVADALTLTARRRQALAAEWDGRLRPAPGAERARQIVEESQRSLVSISTEVFYESRDGGARVPLLRREGTGFAIAADRIATAKEVIEPWKYDAPTLARIRLLEESRPGLRVGHRIEVWVREADRRVWETRLDSETGLVNLESLGPDALEDEARDVEVEWNQTAVTVPGIRVRRRHTGALAILAVTGGALSPLSVTGAALTEGTNALVVGMMRDSPSSSPRLLRPSPARAEVQSLLADPAGFTLNVDLPPAFAGAPVFAYDGHVRGLVSGPEGTHVRCAALEFAPLPGARAAR